MLLFAPILTLAPSYIRLSLFFVRGNGPPPPPLPGPPLGFSLFINGSLQLLSILSTVVSGLILPFFPPTTIARSPCSSAHGRGWAEFGPAVLRLPGRADGGIAWLGLPPPEPDRPPALPDSGQPLENARSDLMLWFFAMVFMLCFSMVSFLWFLCLCARLVFLCIRWPPPRRRIG
jgi:hypothetical protein